MEQAVPLPTEEHYHTYEEYERSGIDPFLRHIRDYLRGQRTIPVSKSNVSLVNRIGNYGDVLFTFTDPLLGRFIRGDKMHKPYENAIKYGFRGYSRRGKNGIFYLRKEDSDMRRETQRLAHIHETAILQDLDIKKEGLDALREVKIVWHNPSGERVVGMMNEENQRILFLDFASY
ncbi:MAG: hypothetical protein KJ574_02010 [Nanoarchaeota archaeon]|nr:hypothetical protein [Nanoarchaeota archaeon]